jgi:1-acyl-sn-glycerol-3-phosphate acyltransferase
LTSKTSPPAQFNCCNNAAAHPIPKPEIGLFNFWGKCGSVAIQLLHALLHFRKLGFPSPADSGASLRARAVELHKLSRALLGHLKVRHEVSGPLPTAGLLVTNHLGFLDIMTLSALQPMVFVSKSEVSRWPLVGDIASCAGTIYVERTRRGDVSRVNSALRQRLNAGLLLTIFPEGTSSDGSSVLPFQPSLLQPAVELKIPVTPGHVSYTGSDGRTAEDIAYYGDRDLESCLLALLRRQQVTAHIHFATAFPPALDRKTLAADLHATVSRLGG